MTRNKVIQMKKHEQLESGDNARVSGFYLSNHPGCRGSGALWVRRGERLPVCADCGRSATFIMKEAVGHISEDPDFC